MTYLYELNNKLDSKFIDLNLESLPGKASYRVKGIGGEWMELWKPAYDQE